MKTTIALSLMSTLAGPVLAGSNPDYTLHEWGTFTTLSASTGALLPGVQREEEPLPEFVESHEGMEHHNWMRAIKGWKRPLAGVTVRMETPVIYFYTKDSFDVQVDVGFKGGSISQWYPTRSAGEVPPPVKRDANNWPLPDVNTLDFAKGYDGSIRWSVRVQPAGDDAFGRLFKPGETPSWIYPRHPDSALVTTKNGQTEKFLFYRGLGNFTLPVTFTSSGPGVVTIRNTGTHTAGGFLIYETGHSAAPRWVESPALAAGESRTISLATAKEERNWQNGVYEAGIRLLTGAGLYRKEADAMLQTWWPSYFERQGLRVFWVVPRPVTEVLLPLTVSPAPKETVRVLVGRSEVLSPDFERLLVSEFAKAKNEDEANPRESDRYFPAYEERVRQLNAASSGGR